MKLTRPRPQRSVDETPIESQLGQSVRSPAHKTNRAEPATQPATDSPADGWLLQCAPGLSTLLNKELVFVGAVPRDQKIFVKRQRNHDLMFLNRLKSDEGMNRVRIAETVLRCPVYGRFKISKRQLSTIAEELKSLGPRRLVVSVAGRVFERHDLSRWVTKEIAARGYDFGPEVEEETWMFCIDESWYFGIPIQKAKQTAGRAARLEERVGSLPPPVAAAMVFAAMPKPDDVIIDPVCGSGTLLAECHAYMPSAQLLGLDIDPSAISVAKRNLQHVPNLKLSAADSQKSGLKENNLSLVLANLPFGVQYGDKKSNPALYRDILKEMLRLRDVTKQWRAILFTSDVASLGLAMSELPELSSESLFTVKVRGEAATGFRVRLR